MRRHRAGAFSRAERGVWRQSAAQRRQISAQPLPLGCTWPSRSLPASSRREWTMLASKTPSRAHAAWRRRIIALTLLGAGFAAWCRTAGAQCWRTRRLHSTRTAIVTGKARRSRLTAMEAAGELRKRRPLPALLHPAERRTRQRLNTWQSGEGRSSVGQRSGHEGLSPSCRPAPCLKRQSLPPNQAAAAEGTSVASQAGCPAVFVDF